MIALAGCWHGDDSRTPAPKPRVTARCPDEMARVPAGTFTMGHPSDNPYALEAPAHRVTLDAYCIDRTEVTVDAYAKCVAAGGCAEAPRTWDHLPGNPVYPDPGLCNGGKPGLEEHPINCVTWFHAEAYCAWAGKRLPTEAEWEHAARGDDGRTFPWGNDDPVRDGPEDDKLVWHARGLQQNVSITMPVGSFPAGASPYGLLDMAGNVEEWVADWAEIYAPDPVKNPKGATMPVDGRFGAWAERFRDRYGALPNPDPEGKRPALQVGRIVRGGGIGYSDPRNYYMWERSGDRSPEWRDFDLGFRCAR